MRLALAVACASLLAPVAAFGQGLGGVAKKEQARRAKAPASPPKSYTEADLRPSGDEAGGTDDGGTNAHSQAAGEGRAPDAQAGPASRPAERRDLDAESAQRQRDEETWRARVAEARNAVEAARRKHEALAGKTLVPGYVLVDEHGRTVVQSVEQLQGMTRRAKQELDAAERGLADLLETARRANVPPGWLR